MTTMNNTTTTYKFTPATFVSTVNGYEMVSARNEFHNGKMTGFTNFRFSVKTTDAGTVYTDIDGREWNVRDVYGYRNALQLDLPRMAEICPPLHVAACEILRNW